MIQVKIFYAQNDLRNFSYLISDKSTGDSFAIDPYDGKPIIEYIKKEGLTLKGILNTHHHWDHIKGNEALQSVCNCSVYKKEQLQIDLPDQHVIKFLETPGHAADHLAFCWQRGQEAIGLFSGDTLFNSGVGNCKGGGASLDALYETTNRLKKMSDDVVLYPGHDYVLKNLEFAKSLEPENKDIDEALKRVKAMSTEEGIGWTLGQEKKVNPFLRLDSSELRENVLHEKNEHDQKKLFLKLRGLRDTW